MMYMYLPYVWQNPEPMLTRGETTKKEGDIFSWQKALFPSRGSIQLDSMEYLGKRETGGGTDVTWKKARSSQTCYQFSTFLSS